MAAVPKIKMTGQTVNSVTSINTDHEDMIHDAQMDFYGRLLATCSSDRTIKIYEVTGESYKLVGDLRGHEGPVWQISWAHPMFGNLLASCSYDRKVIIWKECGNNDFQMIYESQHHDSSVNSICWAPREYGLMLACGASDGVVSIVSMRDKQWEIEKIPHAHSSIGCNAVSWAFPVQYQQSDLASDGSTFTYKKRIVSGGCDNLVKIWIYSDQENKWIEEDTLDGHSDWVRDVAFAPNCGLDTSILASCSLDCRVIIWKRNEKENGPWTSQVLNKFNSAIWHLSWSIAGNILAISGADNQVSLWKETPDGSWVCISDVEKGQTKPPSQ